MQKIIRIGTRDSQLALWQANKVACELEKLSYKTVLVPLKSTGDIVLDKPLYELGITGIFTKTLDIALLADQIDIAVHSMKDVPTQLPKGIIQAAVLERANTTDTLVFTKPIDFEKEGVVATGSLRRKAQWLHRYPHHKTVDLRGNVNSRLQKLNENNWIGAIFASAGLERLNLKPDQSMDLDWMIPAPAQGAIMIVTKLDDSFCIEALDKINHFPTHVTTAIERQFLRTLEGGCTAPIGAKAEWISENKINFTGSLFSLDGSQKKGIETHTTISDYQNFGQTCADKILQEGGLQLMQEIQNQIGKI